MGRQTLILLGLILTFHSSCDDTKNQNSNDVYQVKYNFTDNRWTGHKVVDSLRLLSSSIADAGDYKRFKQLCDTLMKLDSTSTDHAITVALIYFLESDNQRAMTLTNQAIRFDTNKIHIENLDLMKALIFRTSRNSDSTEYYLKRISKNGIVALKIIIDRATKFQFYAKIPDLIDFAYELYPTDSDILYYKAAIAANKQKFDEALNYLVPIEKTYLNNDEYFLIRSYCYSRLKSYDKALADVNKAITMDSIPKYFTHRGRVKQRMNNLQSAEIDYKYAISKGDTTAMRLIKTLGDKLD